MSLYCGGRNLHRPTGEVMFSFVCFLSTVIFQVVFSSVMNLC